MLLPAGPKVSDSGSDDLITPLDRALAEVWSVFSDQEGLIAYLKSDAVLSRSRAGEFRFCLPRLLELLVNNQLEGEAGFVLANRLQVEGWQSWKRSERDVLETFFDTWWLQTRMFDDGLVPASEVLGVLIHLGLPLVRWLGPWLEDLDGPPARHFAHLILEGFETPAWQHDSDLRGQVEGWAASEPCIFGIALVGGIHLPEGQLSEVLDRLV